jgi:hypothetical protein
MMLLSACASTQINNYCLWGEPITVTQDQIDALYKDKSMHSLLRQLDNQQQEWQAHCGE